MIVLIILIIILSIALVGLFAGSEMGYLSCNKLKLRHLADEGNRNARIVMRFHQDPKRFLTTILIGTNFLHVVITAHATYLGHTFFNIKQEWIITAILAPVIVIFAETIPKDWFRQKSDDFIYRVAPLLGFFDALFSSFSKVLMLFTAWIMSLVTSGAKRDPYVTREEFRYVIEESAKKGVLMDQEKRLVLDSNLKTY